MVKSSRYTDYRKDNSSDICTLYRDRMKKTRSISTSKTWNLLNHIRLPASFYGYPCGRHIFDVHKIKKCPPRRRRVNALTVWFLFWIFSFSFFRTEIVARETARSLRKMSDTNVIVKNGEPCVKNDLTGLCDIFRKEYRMEIRVHLHRAVL